MPPIRLVGHIDMPPDRRTEVAAALPAHIRPTRAESGCRAFDVTPDPNVAGRWRVLEFFDDRAAFDRHQARARASDRGSISAGPLRSSRIEEGAP